jgi:signal transduction histidine kinase
VRDTSLPASRAGAWRARGTPAEAGLPGGATAAAGPARAHPSGDSLPDSTAATAPDRAGASGGGTTAGKPAQASVTAVTLADPRRVVAGAVAGWPTVAWLLVWVLSLVAYVIVGRRDAMLFYFVWFGSAMLWGFRISGVKPTLSVLAAMVATAVAAVGLDAWPREPAGEAAVLLMAAVFMVLVWQVHRRQSADAERDRVSQENARLLAAQRRFLQDASHQLKTPITIALGHAELLARDLAGRAEQRDIHVVAGELARLKSLSERLLLIASSEDPEFLHLEPVALDSFIMEALRRWRPAAQRRWQVGHLHQVMVRADRERLGLALDALLENAVQHTGTGDAIRLSVLRDTVAATACLVVEDTGEGIARAELEFIFDRFRTGSGGGTRRTGLGLALARAITRGHGGEVRVRSAPSAGSRFEFVLPAMVPPGDIPSKVSESAQASGPCADVNLR